MADNLKSMGSLSALKGKSSFSGMILNESTSFHVREAFKTIRSNLLFTLATKESKAIAVTSAMPDEGKSTTCVNLAVVLAETGAQVLLVDCDLRKPTVHRMFHLSSDKGVTSILCGINKIEQALHENVKANLDVITAGPISPNPSELLGSTQMSEFLKIVQKAYDYVVLDTPPLNVVSDALLVSQQIAGLLMVTRQEQSRHDQLRKAIGSCEFANVNILGIVVNDVKGPSSGYYRYGKYGSSYAYAQADTQVGVPANKTANVPLKKD